MEWPHSDAAAKGHSATVSWCSPRPSRFLTSRVLFLGLYVSIVFVLCAYVQLPPYGVVSLGCYALGMLGYGVMVFPTTPEEGKLLQKVRKQMMQF